MVQQADPGYADGVPEAATMMSHNAFPQYTMLKAIQQSNSSSSHNKSSRKQH